MAALSGNPAILDVTNFDLKQASWHCDQLERGKVLFFSHVPFEFPDADRAFLLSQKQTGSRFHKNISYRPARDILEGVDDDSPDRERMNAIMRNFSSSVTKFIAQFLAPYAGKMKLDFASFRPLEEQGRDLSLHKRNDLLHVDAFPSRPMNGPARPRLRRAAPIAAAIPSTTTKSADSAAIVAQIQAMKRGA